MADSPHVTTLDEMRRRAEAWAPGPHAERDTEPALLWAQHVIEHSFDTSWAVGSDFVIELSETSGVFDVSIPAAPRYGRSDA